jgi:integrase
MRGLGRTYQRGAIWWIAYWHNGKLHRESSQSPNDPTSGRREADAKALLKKRLGEIGRGKLIGARAEKVTFKELSADLETDYKINDKRSLRSVKLSIRHLEKVFGTDRAMEIRTDRIKSYISKRQDEGASNASINRELSALGRMFSLAIEAEKLVYAPHVPRLEENNARQGFLDHGSFLTLQEKLPEYLKDPIWFLYLSGWRKGEMQSLEWRDVDLPGKAIRLRAENSKNKRPRFLALSGELLEVIQRAHARRRLGCRLVFHKDGDPVANFRKSWWKACVAAGLGWFEKIGEGKSAKKVYHGLIVHDLRRTAVRNMVRAGISEKTAMERSGHRTRAIFDRYDITSEKDQAEASEKLNQYLESQPVSPKVAMATRN